jgi:hypothetical protein
MFCENLKLDFPVDQPQLFSKVELCYKSLEFFIQQDGVIFNF